MLTTNARERVLWSDYIQCQWNVTEMTKWEVRCENEADWWCDRGCHGPTSVKLCDVIAVLPSLPRHIWINKYQQIAPCASALSYTTPRCCRTETKTQRRRRVVVDINILLLAFDTLSRGQNSARLRNYSPKSRSVECTITKYIITM